MEKTETDDRGRMFADTEWSLVLSAGRDGPANAAALARLCRRYWLPLFAYVRLRGFSHHDAEDLTQGFFAQVLRRGSLTEADPERGRFRTFLLSALSNFLANEHAKATAAKRGGRFETLPFDEASTLLIEGLLGRSSLTPDQVFDRAWALTVLEQSLRALETALGSEGKARWFARVQPFLQVGPSAGEYESIAREFGMTRNGVAVGIHRLNGRYRDLVRATVAESVVRRSDAEAEFQHLLACLAP